MKPFKRVPLLQGSLDLLILHTLRFGVMHGYSISLHIKTTSDDVLQVEEGSLYPALHRLEHRGWIKSYWGVSESNRRAKFYQLSAEGRRQLKAETAAWEHVTSAIDRVLNFQN